MNELRMVEWIRRQAGPMPKHMVLGIGDDAAVLRPKPSEDLLLKTDPSIEGIHFKSDARPEIVGNRALARNLSDIAAMGGRPLACLVSLSIGPRHDQKWIKAFFRGLLKLAKQTGTPLVGGDLAHSRRETHVDVMLTGAVARGKSLRRDGARLSDFLYVSGALGKPWDRTIEPRLDLGRRLLGRATSCIDISDGIALDLHRLCLASGCSARIDEVPITKNATLERALHGGEDYELLFTVPRRLRPPAGVIRIGEIVAGKPGSVSFRGKPLPPRGYDHFGMAIK